MSQFEGRDKLDGAKVFGPLCDDPCDLLGRPEVHLWTQKPLDFTNTAKEGLKENSNNRNVQLVCYLQPLRPTVGGGGPGVGLSLFVQPGVVGVPGEGLEAPGAEGAGGRDLAVGHQPGLHAHRL